MYRTTERITVLQAIGSWFGFESSYCAICLVDELSHDTE